MHSTAVSLLEQLDISLQDMMTHITESWTGQIGGKVFQDISRQAVVGQSVFMSVLSLDHDKQSRKRSLLDESADTKRC